MAFKMNPGSKEKHSDDIFPDNSPMKRMGTPMMSPLKNTGKGGYVKGRKVTVDKSDIQRDEFGNKYKKHIYEKEGAVGDYGDTEAYRRGYGRTHVETLDGRHHTYNPNSPEASEKGYAPVWKSKGDGKVYGSAGYSPEGLVVERALTKPKQNRGLVDRNAGLSATPLQKRKKKK